MHAKNNNLRIIGCTTKERFPLFKDVPSLYEQGLAGFDYANWYGSWGPADMPPEVTTKLNQDLQAVLTSHVITGKFAEQGWVVKVGTPGELDTLARTQLAKWREVVAQTKVELD